MKDAATKLHGKTKKELYVLPTEDQETKQQEDRIKELRKKQNRSEREREKVEYTELNKTI